MLPRRGNLNNIATRISPFPYTHIFPLNLKTMGSERVSEGEREPGQARFYLEGKICFHKSLIPLPRKLQIQYCGKNTAVTCNGVFYGIL